MTIKVLTNHHLEFLSLKVACTCSSKSIHVKMSHCWKSHVAAHIDSDQTQQNVVFNHLMRVSLFANRNAFLNLNKIKR